MSSTPRGDVGRWEAASEVEASAGDGDRRQHGWFNSPSCATATHFDGGGGEIGGMARLASLIGLGFCLSSMMAQLAL